MKKLFALALLFCTWVASGQQVIGTIDFYGAAAVDTVAVLNRLGIHTGAPGIVNTSDLSRKLLKLPGIKRADVAGICCQDGKQNVFIGIDDGSLPTLTLRPISGTTIKLPHEVVTAYQKFEIASRLAVQAGDNGDDLEQGHSLLKNDSARKYQLQFIDLANRYTGLLLAVLEGSTVEREREIASMVLAYADDKSFVAGKYAGVLNDPSPAVRNNLLRAFHGFGLYGKKHPDADLHIDMKTFLVLLHSVQWTDRDKALFALLALTDSRPKGIMEALQKQAIPALEQMARWKSEGHAILAFIILGRAKGIPDESIFQSWQGDRGVVLGAGGN